MENTANVDEIAKKIRKKVIHPKFFLKRFFIYLGLMKKEQDIDAISSNWNKELLIWIIEVGSTGLILNLTLFSLFSHIFPRLFRFNWYTWFFWGVFVYITQKTHRGIIDGKKEVARAK